MLSNMVDLSTAVLAFETVLKIEYDEPDTKKVIQNAIRKLETAYGMRIEGKTLYDLQSENINLADNIQNLLQQILECTKTTSFLFQNGMYHHSIPITLSSVKYLGLGKVALQTILRYFQNENEYYLSRNTVPQLVLGLDGVDMCTVKKMFIILLVLDQLGVTESVSVLAQYLYYGSVWEDKNGSAYR